MAKKRRHIYLLEKLQRGKTASPTLSKAELRELEQYENDPAYPGIVNSQEKVAKVFDVSIRTVQNWVRDGMPVSSEGKYDLLEVRAWRLIRSQRKRSKEGKKTDWEQRYREYKARLTELELKKEMGEVIDLRQAEKEIIYNILGIKRRLLALPKEIAPQLAGLETRKIFELLTSRLNELLSGFAQGLYRVTRGREIKTNKKRGESHA